MNVTKKALIVAKAIAFATILNGQAKIVIKGSDTLGAKMIPKLAEAYENKIFLTIIYISNNSRKLLLRRLGQCTYYVVM